MKRLSVAAGPAALMLTTCTGCNRCEEAPMTGVVFFKTQMLDELTTFYTERVGAELWMDQTDCRIFRHGQFLFGFCQREAAETCGVITFVYPDRAAVDRMYERFQDSALDPPRDNPRYPIYNFFARDPESRLIEFQVFNSDADWSFSQEMTVESASTTNEF